MSPQRQCVPHLCPDTHCLPHQVGLPEDDLHARVALHRGVYCRGGALTPTDTTLFTLCPAQHFNACLPLGGKRLYRCPGHTEAEGVLCFRVSCNSTRLCAGPITQHSPPASCAQDTAALCAHGNAAQVAPGGDTRCFYVLQLEVDLLTGSLLPSGGPSDDTRGPEDGPLSHSMYRVLGPGVNEEAISRVWLAKRDSGGTFLTCDPPTGAHP